MKTEIIIQPEPASAPGANDIARALAEVISLPGAITAVKQEELDVSVIVHLRESEAPVVTRTVLHLLNELNIWIKTEAGLIVVSLLAAELITIIKRYFDVELTNRKKSNSNASAHTQRVNIYGPDGDIVQSVEVVPEVVDLTDG